MKVDIETLKIVLDESERQWNDFKEDRKDCTIEDYNNFVLEIAEQLSKRNDEG